MEYFVIAPDGKEYGPATVAVLKQAVQENRLSPQSPLKDASSGQQLAASQVPGLFAQAPSSGYVSPPPAGTYAPAAQQNPTAGPYQGAPTPHENWSQAPSPYARPTYQPPPSRGNSGVLWRSIAYSALALFLFFVVGGLGLIVGSYGVYYGYQAMESDHQFGKVAFAVSIIALLLVIGGWALRLNHVRMY